VAAHAPGDDLGVEPLPSDASLIMDSMMSAHEKLDAILTILRDDEEEAEDETDA
jgi:hypothetical protein